MGLVADYIIHRFNEFREPTSCGTLYVFLKSYDTVHCNNSMCATKEGQEREGPFRLKGNGATISRRQEHQL